MQRTQHGGPLQLDIRLYDNASSDTTIVEIRRFAPDVPLKVSPINRGYGVAHTHDPRTRSHQPHPTLPMTGRDDNAND